MELLKRQIQNREQRQRDIDMLETTKRKLRVLQMDEDNEEPADSMSSIRDSSTKKRHHVKENYKDIQRRI